MKDRSSHEILPDDKPVPFFPDHLMTEFWVAMGFLGLAIIVGAIGMFMPVGLQDPADPLNTPLHVKPEWYFLFLYQLLKVVPDYVFFGQIEGRVLVTVGTIVGLMALMLLPFFDKKDDTKRAWWIRAGLSALVLIIIIALTIWGEVS
jgi:quinol-cytochrome oxidoreductase complex cytochrome b subunit